MSLVEAILYGFIQGLSEFLPVSSSGHLALLPHVINIKDPGVVFDLMMHLGTAFAVLTYFRKDIFRYVKTFNPALVDFQNGNADQWFVRNFIFSTLVSVFCIMILLPVSKYARDPLIVVFNLTIFGGFLWLSDIKNIHNKKTLISPMVSGAQWRLAALIGSAQALAIFPGVSRSGITLTAALFLGMRRKEAGEFSFLLSLPIILAGILKEVPDLMKNSNDSTLLVLIVGVCTSFLVGWATIHFFMKLISKIELKYFCFYRWFLAGLMLLVL